MVMVATYISPQSAFFAIAQEEVYAPYQLLDNNDVWSACRANEHYLSMANSAGFAFPPVPFQDFAFKVQVHQHFTWVDVSGLSVTPDSPCDQTARTNGCGPFTFDETWGSGRAQYRWT